ncbi:hypothetical protein [Pseudovibrio ascidiaceicola]|nr:hypothetical protein [Pseudovibrio ascidiaceicola]
MPIGIEVSRYLSLARHFYENFNGFTSVELADEEHLHVDGFLIL